MSASIYGLIAIAYTIGLIAGCAYISNAVARRTRSTLLGAVVFAALMLLMWFESLYRQLILRPELCARPEAGVQVYATATLPPEYYTPSGSMSERFSEMSSGESRHKAPKKLVANRYFRLTEYEQLGSGFLDQHTKRSSGIWDFEGKRWMAVETTYQMSKRNWWAWPLYALPESSWARSRISSNSVCEGRPQSLNALVFGFR